MWPFILTRSINLQRRIKASKAEVLSIVQDPDEVLRIGPLVFSVTQDDQDPAWYTVTDRLPILGSLYESTTSFRCRWVNVEDGADVDVFAGVGTYLQNKMRVVDMDSEEEEVEFQEILVVQGLFCLMPYITSTITKAHTAVHDAVADKVLAKKNATSASVDHLFQNPLIYLAVLLLTLSVWFKMRFTDPYGLFHLTLNKLPSEDPNSPPLTEWLNMGYWKDTNIFPEACKALALKLIAAANLKEGGRVLDVGHGTGESLLLILSEPSIPRPYHLVGITSLDVHHQRSVERVQKYQNENGGPTATNVNLYHGDAVYDGVVSEHPFHPTSKEVYDAILALDCAYHFHSRRLFLQQSFSKLAPGGRVALADICFDSSALETRRTRVLTSTMKLMPAENVISDQEYIAQVEGIGFVDVSLEDITPDVFPGFVKFLKGRKWGWWVFGSIINWYAHAGARFVIVSGRKP